MIKIYKIFSYFLIPIIIINLYFRILSKKEDSERLNERFGRTKIKLEKSKKIIWLHASSVGEFKSSDLIIQKYYQKFHILVTTTTKSSAEYIKKFYSRKVIHQYIPYDVPIWCDRFINYWKPSLILWIESDIWPNMLKIIRDKKIVSYYINARISPRSYNKWKYLKKLYLESLATFNKIYAQSPNDLERLKNLTNLDVKYIGNLKLSNNKVNININKSLKRKYTVMIVSSHKMEEEKIIKAIQSTIKKENLKICIAPRHTKRINEIMKILQKYKLSYILESNDTDLNNTSDVTIVDSFGNLNMFFNNSEIVVLGGSFVNKGGHNPLEPAKYGCAIISGNFIHNWKNIYDEMTRENACIIINDINELKNRIDELMLNKLELKNLKMKSLNFSRKKFFDNEYLIKEIDLVIN